MKLSMESPPQAESKENSQEAILAQIKKLEEFQQWMIQVEPWSGDQYGSLNIPKEMKRVNEELDELRRKIEEVGSGE